VARDDAAAAPLEIAEAAKAVVFHIKDPLRSSNGSGLRIGAMGWTRGSISYGNDLCLRLIPARAASERQAARDPFQALQRGRSAGLETSHRDTRPPTERMRSHLTLIGAAFSLVAVWAAWAALLPPVT
jgi:hypothetical protein